MWDDKSQCGDMQKEERADFSANYRGNKTKSKTTKDIFIWMPHLWRCKRCFMETLWQ